MKTLHLIILILAAAVAAAVAADDSDTAFFHPAASRYIHGDSVGASNLVAQGLALHPDDGKLKRLKELIEKQQDQQQDQNQEQNQDQNKDQQQNQNQDQNQDQDPNQDPNQDQNQDQSGQQDAPNQPEPEPPRAEQMSQDEAERLLDAMKQEEENKRLQLHPVMGAPVKVDKDW